MEKGKLMLQENKWGQFFIRFIQVIFMLIMTVLIGMSFFEHCEADIFSYLQERYIVEHRPILYVGLAIIGTICLLVLCHGITKFVAKSKDTWKLVRRVLIICVGIVFAACVFWILFNDTVPKYDQKILFKEARVIAGYLDEVNNAEYFIQYPRNKGTLLLMAFMLKIFGDSMLSFRMLNVIGAVILLVSAALSTKRTWKDERATIITALFMAIYYPIIIYTCYLYGTLLSTSFSALGVYGSIRFCKDKKWKYFILVLIGYTLGVQMHQSAAIVMIAGMFYLLIHTSKDTLCRTVVCMIMMVGMFFASNKISDFIYYDVIAEVEPGDSVPTLAYIYMGINAVDGVGGPGSQDGSNWTIFEENNCDAKATNQDAWNRIVKIISEYMSGERSLSFFVEKVKFQWLDPTFGSRRIIETNYPEQGEPLNSEAYLKVRNSSLRNVGFKIAVVGMMITYGLNWFVAIYQIIRKEQDGLSFFIQILLVGGFVFQLFWESISRYCFSYFVWLIPGAACGLVLLYNVIIKIITKYSVIKNENRSIQ